jgi:hypothetical protein
MNIPWEVERAGPEAIRVFKESISSGATEKFATMCAVRIAPGTKGSDRAFMEGRMNNQQLDDMPEIMARRMARDARDEERKEAASKSRQKRTTSACNKQALP